MEINVSRSRIYRCFLSSRKIETVDRTDRKSFREVTWYTAKVSEASNDISKHSKMQFAVIRRTDRVTVESITPVTRHSADYNMGVFKFDPHLELWWKHDPSPYPVIQNGRVPVIIVK